MMPSVSAAAAAFLALSAALSAVHATDCNFDGGFALRDPEGCPDYTSECGGGIESRCCPDTLYCHVSNTAYCCPSEDEDCWEDLLNVPHCPLANWTMWSQSSNVLNGSWCCESDMYGIYMSSGAGCTELGSQLATTLSEAAAIVTAPSTCTSSTSASASVSASSAASSTTSLSATTIASVAQPGPTVAGTTTATATATNSSTPGASLGGGAIAGIAIGAAAGGVLVLAAVWALWWQRRKASYLSTAAAIHATDLPPKSAHPAELKGSGPLDVQHQVAIELPALHIAELPAPHQ